MLSEVVFLEGSGDLLPFGDFAMWLKLPHQGLQLFSRIASALESVNDIDGTGRSTAGQIAVRLDVGYKAHLEAERTTGADNMHCIPHEDPSMNT